MPIVGLSLGATWAFESKHDPDRGTERATKFTLTTLDSRVSGKLRDAGTTVHVDPNRPDDEVDTSINMEEVAFQKVQFGCTGWENLVDEKGAPIEYKTVPRRLGGKSYKIVDPDVLALVPGAVIRELAAEIDKRNELTEDEAKN